MQISHLRFIQAYFTTGRVFSSYFFLWTLKKIFGPSRLKLRSEKLHQKNARLVLSTILDLKGIFIKVGQMMSIMTNFLPPSFTAELEGLQDSVPPHSYGEIERSFFDSFRKKPTELFDGFEPVPIASASLGQVHVAYLYESKDTPWILDPRQTIKNQSNQPHSGVEGEAPAALPMEGATRAPLKVAVKIRYPGIEQIVKADLKILKRIFSFLNLVFPNYGLKQTYREISEIVIKELSFTNEGKNLETIRENFKGETNFLFPKVFWDYSNEHVLTLEFMEGIKISNTEQLKKSGIDPTEVATRIIHAYCKQIFIDGVYHADPHPGNFLVRAAPTGPQIVMMDFGAIARISEKMRRGSAQFIEGIIRRDNRIISQAMKEMGFIAKTQNEEVFDRIVEFFYSRLKNVTLEDVRSMNLTNLGSIEDLIEFKKLDISFRDLLDTFNIPKDWALMERALLLLYGLTSHLDPNLNPLSIIIPYAEQFVLGKDKQLKDLVAQALKEIVLSYLKLPDELYRTLKRLNQGEIEVTSKSAREGSSLLALGLKRLNLTLFTLGAASTGYLLYKEGVQQYPIALYAGGFFGLWLLWTMVRGK